MPQKIALPLVAALSLLAYVGAASSDGHADKAMQDAIKARKNQMQLIGYNMGILGAMAKGEAEFDTTRASAAATSLAALSKLDRSILWVEGSIQGEVPETRAKAEIWSDAAGFEEAATALENATDGLVSAAGTDLDALRGAMGAAGKSCGGCHDDFRGPRN